MYFLCTICSSWGFALVYRFSLGDLMLELKGKWLGFLLVGGTGTDSARGICVGFVVLLMNCSSACSRRRWHKTLTGITIGAKERLVCPSFILHLFYDCLSEDCSINFRSQGFSVTKYNNQMACCWNDSAILLDQSFGLRCSKYYGDGKGMQDSAGYSSIYHCSRLQKWVAIVSACHLLQLPFSSRIWTHTF